MHRVLIGSALVLVVGVGCAAKQKTVVQTDQTDGAAKASAPRTPPPAEPSEPAPRGPQSFGPIYYTLDSAQLGPEATRTLQELADYLRREPTVLVTVNGHTCELGTTEYNMALGSQRAKAARDYLVRLGVEPKRVGTLSFGEERPAESGESESAWSRNRRSELEIRISDARAQAR
jgi:peptidoglycan-associated lipoprotein